MTTVDEEVKRLFQSVLSKAKKISTNAYRLLYGLMKDHVDARGGLATTVATHKPKEITSAIYKHTTEGVTTEIITASTLSIEPRWHETVCSKLYSEAYCNNGGTCVKIMHTADDTSISLACRCMPNYYGSRCQYYNSHLNAMQQSLLTRAVYRDLIIVMLVLLFFVLAAGLLYFLYRKKLLCCRNLYSTNNTNLACSTSELDTVISSTYSITSQPPVSTSSISKDTTSVGRISVITGCDQEVRRRNRESRDLEELGANLSEFLEYAVNNEDVPCKTPFMQSVALNFSTSSVENSRFCYDNKSWKEADA